MFSAVPISTTVERSIAYAYLPASFADGEVVFVGKGFDQRNIRRVRAMKHGELRAGMVAYGVGAAIAERFGPRHLGAWPAPQYHGRLDHFVIVDGVRRRSAFYRLTMAPG